MPSINPTFRFVHGFGCDRDTWRPQVEALSSTFGVEILDFPGHGKSSLPEAHDLATLAPAVDVAKDRWAHPVICKSAGQL